MHVFKKLHVQTRFCLASILLLLLKLSANFKTFACCCLKVSLLLYCYFTATSHASFAAAITAALRICITCFSRLNYPMALLNSLLFLKPAKNSQKHQSSTAGACHHTLQGGLTFVGM
jgi:hypothetical protein